MNITLLDTQEIAQELLAKNAQIYTFTGSLGAGKTTLVQAMLKELGVTEITQSPTYTYVNRYTAADGRTIYHFDLYRLNTLDDFSQSGFEEYIHDPNGICFVEWPEIIKPILDSSACHVNLEYKDDKSRTLKIT